MRTRNSGTTMRYVYNDLGEPSDYPKQRVTSALQLHMGDHVAFPRRMDNTDFIKYWHHGIVESVDYKNETIQMIHYQPNFERASEKRGLQNLFKPKGTVVSSRHFLQLKEVFLVEHDPDVCFDAYKVVERAKSKLEENDYNLLWNNCEHFAHWCKTGRKVSEQGRTGGKVAGQFCGSTSGKVASKAFLQNVVRVGQTVGRKGARLVRLNGLFAVVGGIVTAGFAGHDVAKARRMRKSGKLSQKEYERAVGTRVTVAVGDFSGALAGMAIGSAVAGPVGAVVGGVVGGAIGTVLGSAAAKVGVEVVDTLHAESKAQLEILNRV